MNTIQDVSEFLEYCKSYKGYGGFQADLLSNDITDHKELAEYLISICETYNLDELGTSLKLSDFQRKKSDKTLEEVLEIMPNCRAGKTGLKFDYHQKFIPINSENLKDGHIFGLVNFEDMASKTEYFIWVYINIDKAEELLNKFHNKLIDYRKW